jgi:hypothetical protein
MATVALMEIAADPALIPGVYKGCDQWCQYCPVTARCLAFRCKPSGINTEDIFNPAAVRAAAIHVKECHEAEGMAPPEEIMRFLGADPREQIVRPLDKDPLERMGWRYAALATSYLGTRSDIPSDLPKRSDGPTPFELFLYDHVLIVLKIGRAILSAAEAARTSRPEARWDADASAKVALVSIDRSDEALQVMALDDGDPRIEQMRAHLRRLGREVDARFPAARSLVRPGLDA